MSRKAIRYIVTILAVTVCFSAFSLAAFAETSETEPASGTSQTQAAGETGESGEAAEAEQSTSQVQPNSGDSGSAASSQPESDRNEGGTSGGSITVERESDDGKILITFDLNGGKGMNTSAKVSKGTTVSEFKTPTRKGYHFAGWMLDGNQVSGSQVLNEPATLTAAWTREASSDTVSVDTHQSQIEAAASAAEQAANDEGTLSSEDWSSLLGASSSADASSAVSSAAAASSEAQQAGGAFSSLFLAGVILVVLGAAGIGTFIYLQFIRGGGGKGGPRDGGGSGGAPGDTIVFTDISSFSNGKKRNAELYGAVRQPVPEQKAAPAEQTSTNAGPAESAPKRDRAAEKPLTEPTDGANSSFDWERFFNEDGHNEK
jgi:uncharacterized repeat protein (TIGR02543 family)